MKKNSLEPTFRKSISARFQRCRTLVETKP